MAKTIGFYQNFTLDLQRLSSALRCIQGDPEMGHSALAHCMSVNQPVAEGFSAWLRHTGLTIAAPRIESQKTSNHKLTPFGEHNGFYTTIWQLGEPNAPMLGIF